MSQLIIYVRAQSRTRQKHLYDSVNFFPKAMAETRNFKLVAQCGFKQFLLCFRMKLVIHPSRRARRRWKTNGPGTPFTFPSTSSR